MITDLTFVSLVLAAAAMLTWKRSMLDALIEALNNFRGGPPTAMHPLPSNDTVLLLRRRARKLED